MYPRYDLHRHLGGSISCEAVADIKNMPLEEVQKAMTYQEDDSHNYEHFFNKFKILNDVEWNRQNVEHTIIDTVWNLAREKIEYTEIKFSVNKYLPYLDMPIDKIILWFAYLFDMHASKWGIDVNLVLSLKHEMNKDTQAKIANVIDNDNVAECLTGIDIVGNENYFDVEFYKPIFAKWHDAGKLCMAHVGEINHKQNVYDAINILNVDRICHGIAVADDLELAAMSRDKFIPFDLCLTSNIFTGVATLENHPVTKMLDNGFLVTFGTDDPVVLNTNLDQEYDLLKNIAKLSDSDIATIQKATPNLSSKSLIDKK